MFARDLFVRSPHHNVESRPTRSPTLRLHSKNLRYIDQEFFVCKIEQDTCSGNCTKGAFLPSSFPFEVYARRKQGRDFLLRPSVCHSLAALHPSPLRLAFGNPPPLKNLRFFMGGQVPFFPCLTPCAGRAFLPSFPASPDFVRGGAPQGRKGHSLLSSGLGSSSAAATSEPGADSASSAGAAAFCSSSIARRRRISSSF